MTIIDNIIDTLASPFTLVITAWDKLILTIKGKRIAVLGVRGSGKSTLLRFLSTGVLSTENAQTVSSEKVESFRLSLADFKFDLKSTIDVPGGADAKEQWYEVYKSADHALYLINATDIQISRVQRDLRLAEQWQQDLIDSKKSHPRLIVIVTHMDLVEGYLSAGADIKGSFKDDFIRNNLESGLSKLRKRPHILLGAFDNADRMKSTVVELIKIMGVI
jgi:tRNA U34 5-carboxymethylaminomethyl modifying GTPase MnmE/TrmE